VEKTKEIVNDKKLNLNDKKPHNEEFFVELTFGKDGGH